MFNDYNVATNKQIASVAPAGIGASYAVASAPAPAPANTNMHQAGLGNHLAYRAEATFDAASAITGVTFKIQVSRTGANPTLPLDTTWTDLALYNAAAPGAAPVVDQAIAVSAGATVALDLYSPVAHRGRFFFRVLVRKTGGGAAAGTDAFALWASGPATP